MPDFRNRYFRIVDIFDKDKTASQYLRDDGEGGIASGVYRMARDIERLKKLAGEPLERDSSWQSDEDIQLDADFERLVSRSSTH